MTSKSLYSKAFSNLPNFGPHFATSEQLLPPCELHQISHTATSLFTFHVTTLNPYHLILSHLSSLSLYISIKSTISSSALFPLWVLTKCSKFLSVSDYPLLRAFCIILSRMCDDGKRSTFLRALSYHLFLIHYSPNHLFLIHDQSSS